MPHLWVLERLTILGVNEQVNIFLGKSIKSLEVGLTCGNKSLGSVNIRRGMLQGNWLPPLLFVIALVPLTYLLQKSRPGYEFAKNGEKINCFTLMTSSCLPEVRMILSCSQ